jgi:hypothetical protein
MAYKMTLEHRRMRLRMVAPLGGITPSTTGNALQDESDSRTTLGRSTTK